ncbi:MAG: argininosuccinate synthase [Chloroflexi bacterium]|nr:MAG: argininosuccinate synthase [Chloroflexota bacterium]PIE80896.1 MAG: argininosuccinate synthase [Chloroflexota bacterium]
MNIRPAKETDIPGIISLVAEHAKRGDMLPRTPESIAATLANWLVGIHKDGGVVACVSLSYYSRFLAEVRSLAVSDRVKGQGWGSTIVKAAILEAQHRSIPKLFALTRAVPFFQKIGFSITARELFPQKVWRDCSVCPLIDNCDETAVVLELDPAIIPPHKSIPVNIPVAAMKPSRKEEKIKHISQGVLPMSKAKKQKKQANKVVLAYSGGLDTSVIVPWLKENYGCQVICFCADIGQGNVELEGLQEKAIASGASKVYIEDLRHEFAKDFLFPMLQSGAVYEKEYLLGTSVARPLIAKWQVAIAAAEGADAVAHGATGKGNDQVRFELTFKALNPTLQVIAPWREWEIRSREDAIAYAKKHKVPITHTEKSIYSRDANLWHISHEGGILENPSLEPEKGMFQFTVAPEDAPDKAEIVKVDFEQGVPVAINDVQMPPAAIIEKLNQLGAKHGIGRVDLVENRLVGMKSHGVYETPGGTILYKAHQGVESLCLDRDTLHYKEQMAVRYSELVYNGKWYTPLREAMQAFINSTQQNVTGWSKIKLYKGNAILVGRAADESLYREDFATFGQEDVYDQSDAVGFITLFGLPMKVQAMMEVSDGGKTRYAAPDYSKFKRD